MDMHDLPLQTGVGNIDGRSEDDHFLGSGAADGAAWLMMRLSLLCLSPRAKRDGNLCHSKERKNPAWRERQEGFIHLKVPCLFAGCRKKSCLTLTHETAVPSRLVRSGFILTGFYPRAQGLHSLRYGVQPAWALTKARMHCGFEMPLHTSGPWMNIKNHS